MSKIEQRISRVMSLVLRHDPESIGLTLDRNGWAEIDELIACLKRDGKRVDRELIETIVTKSDNQRFKISENGHSVRANQGHSVDIDLRLEAKSPPEWLYYGTATKFMSSIEREGLLKGLRQHLRLSRDKITAKEFGARHGKPVVLQVASQIMEQHGYRFFLSENGVWLTDHVPPDYLNQRFTFSI